MIWWTFRNILQISSNHHLVVKREKLKSRNTWKTNRFFYTNVLVSAINYSILCLFQEIWKILWNFWYCQYKLIYNYNLLYILTLKSIIWWNITGPPFCFGIQCGQKFTWHDFGSKYPEDLWRISEEQIFKTTQFFLVSLQGYGVQSRMVSWKVKV